LVARAGEVVTRNELREHVWQADTFVDFERGLNYCIAQIRAALGDSAATPRFVETLPRRGYRFIAPVTVDTMAGAPVTGAAPTANDSTVGSPDPPHAGVAPASAVMPPDPTATQAQPAVRFVSIGLPFLAIGLALVCLIVAGAFFAFRGTAPRASATDPDGRVKLAVVLFANETGNTAHDAIAQQLTDLTVARLAAMPDRLGVIGNAAILRQRRTFRDIDAIASALGVQYIVFGQIQPQATPSPSSSPSAPATPALRAIVHLIRTDDETHLWANRFVFDATNLASVEATLPVEVERAVVTRVLEKLQK
jgi:DNA-binding winged helix-turn-helix (wHTH) protein/TolB-like protein